MKLTKQAYTVEFKELVEKWVKEGQSIGIVVEKLGLSAQTLRNGVKSAAQGLMNGAGSRGVISEEMELSRLRAEKGRLKRALKIIKKRRRT